MFKRALRLVLPFATACLIGSAVQATTLNIIRGVEISSSVSIDATRPVTILRASGIDLPTFDTSLGTLNSVTIALQLFGGGRLSVVGELIGPNFRASGRGEYWAAFSLSAANLSLFSNRGILSTACFAPQSANGCQDVITRSVRANDGSTTVTGATWFSSLDGLSNGIVLDHVLMLATQSGIASLEADTQGIATFTFDYTPAAVPLPAGALLLLGALGGMGAIARSRMRA